MHWVYILKNVEGIYYKGSTENIPRRLGEHNSNKGRYTAGKGPWELVYTRSYPTKKEALIEEKRLKKLKHHSLELLIASKHNEICDIDRKVG